MAYSKVKLKSNGVVFVCTQVKYYTAINIVTVITMLKTKLLLLLCH